MFFLSELLYDLFSQGILFTDLLSLYLCRYTIYLMLTHICSFSHLNNTAGVDGAGWGLSLWPLLTTLPHRPALNIQFSTVERYSNYFATILEDRGRISYRQPLLVCFFSQLSTFSFSLTLALPPSHSFIPLLPFLPFQPSTSLPL